MLTCGKARNDSRETFAGGGGVFHVKLFYAVRQFFENLWHLTLQGRSTLVIMAGMYGPGGLRTCMHSRRTRPGRMVCRLSSVLPAVDMASAAEQNPMEFCSMNRKAAACAWLHRKRKCAPHTGGPMACRLKRGSDFFSAALTIQGLNSVK